MLEVCGICSKKLVRGDYFYGACHECAKKTIHNRMKDKKSYTAIYDRHMQNRIKEVN